MSGDDDFDAEVQLLVNEVPKLGDACKNLVAMLSAKSIPTEDPVPVTELLSCARVLLKQLNAHVLVDVVEWGSLHPQGELTAMKRIDQLREYKVVHALRAKAETMGGKVSKLFGKSFVLWSGCWKEVRRACNTAEVRPKDVADDVWAVFLDSFELSLGLLEAESSGMVCQNKGEASNAGAGAGADANTEATASEGTDGTTAEQQQNAVNSVLQALQLPDAAVTSPVALRTLRASADDGDLIWAASFKDALAARRLKREQKVESSGQREWAETAPATASDEPEDP
jgi:hypothetical protein